MPAGRQRVVDRVDLGVLDHVRVAVMHGGDAVLLGERLGAAAVPRGDATHLDVVEARRRFDQSAGSDRGRAQRADSQLPCRPLLTCRPRSPCGAGVGLG